MVCSKKCFLRMYHATLTPGLVSEQHTNNPSSNTTIGLAEGLFSLDRFAPLRVNLESSRRSVRLPRINDPVSRHLTLAPPDINTIAQSRDMIIMASAVADGAAEGTNYAPLLLSVYLHAAQQITPDHTIVTACSLFGLNDMTTGWMTEVCTNQEDGRQFSNVQIAAQTLEAHSEMSAESGTEPFFPTAFSEV